jgi:hypothetical protein
MSAPRSRREIGISGVAYATIPGPGNVYSACMLGALVGRKQALILLLIAVPVLAAAVPAATAPLARAVGGTGRA